jgi:hypothetical protein
MTRLSSLSRHALPKKSLIIGAALSAVLATSWPLAAETNTSPDPHHPEGQQELGPQPNDKAPGTGMQGGHGMMRNMMSMMHMMGQAADTMPCMSNMEATDHIEGRLAFLHAELKINDSQQKAWTQFADRLRKNAKTLGEVRNATMMKPANGEMRPMLPRKLDIQEQALTARLELTRAYRDLYGALSEDQKKIAEKLLIAQMGMGGSQMMMPMGGL